MTIAPKLQALLDALPDDQRLEFNALLIALHKVQYTGPVTFDFFNGAPKQINLGAPIKLTICTGEGS